MKFWEKLTITTKEKRDFLVLCIEVNMNKAVKISQSNVVTQTVLGGPTIYLLVATCLCCIYAKILKVGWQ